MLLPHCKKRRINSKDLASFFKTGLHFIPAKCSGSHGGSLGSSSPKILLSKGFLLLTWTVTVWGHTEKLDKLKNQCIPLLRIRCQWQRVHCPHTWDGKCYHHFLGKWRKVCTWAQQFGYYPLCGNNGQHRHPLTGRIPA